MIGQPFCDGEAPNLDNFTEDEAEMEEARKVFQDYALYLEARRHAHKTRRAGGITIAIEWERTMIEIYARLPGWARW